MKNNYKIFFLMLAVSFIIMYSVMFLNVAAFSHIYLSTTRLYMALLMVAPMAITMLLFKWPMYKNKRINILIISSAVIIFIISLWGLRTQTPIGDKQYMKAMISHHSSAILTSNNANIKDAEVRALADDIIEAQEREIKQMKNILDRLD